MKNYDIFDIIGPIMIGPSSSHTAGAARIGKSARDIYGKDFTSVKFYLHGSFQTTLEGHGSDRALVGGVMGMEADNIGLVDSLVLARQRGLSYEFINENLGEDVHPNTIKVLLESADEDFYIIASSIGGGKIRIININGLAVDLTGERPTIIASYRDKLGMIVDMLTILKKENINIAEIRVTRTEDIANLILELDQPYTNKVIGAIKKMNNIIDVMGIESF